ncbi:methyl-accepting chemotaxis protein [Hansschlegelia quercus]|nr:methyl-accepting chemotaxis protein [Hansschlegelia quercus]
MASAAATVYAHSRHLPQSPSHVASVARTVKSRGGAYRIKTSDGRWRYVHETGGGCERDPATGETLYLDGIILDAGRLTSLATKLDSGRASVKAMNGSIDQILKTLKTLRLLSLNARIEAARANEHGAGFSVVAQEMMGLANAGETVTRAIENELARLNDAIRL